jgi:hypothetical protein
MELFLTPNNTTNTILTTADGVPRYKIETPFKLSGRTSSIRRCSHETNSVSSSDPKSGAEPSEKSSLIRGNEQWTDLAEIHWKAMTSSTLRLGSVEMDISQYLPHKGALRR